MHWILCASLFSVNFFVTTQQDNFWGRVYLRNGLAPIQYFKDTYGGALPEQEVELVFPSDEHNQAGCHKYSDQDTRMSLKNKGLVFIVQRGSCSFEKKSLVSQVAGAAGLLIISDSDEVSRPSANIERGVIHNFAVMVRRSAGSFLRSIVARRERIFGYMTPMRCSRRPYICHSSTVAGTEYIKNNEMRGGILRAYSEYNSYTNSIAGEFVASSFGAPFPDAVQDIGGEANHLTKACTLIEREEIQRSTFLIIPLESDCSTLHIISQAQDQGYVGVLFTISGDENVLHRVTVSPAWLAYNISIPSATIDANFADELVSFPGKNIRLSFSKDNTVSIHWEQIQRLLSPRAWPSMPEQREKLLLDNVHDLVLEKMSRRESVLYHAFIVAGQGDDTTWTRIMNGALQDRAKCTGNDLCYCSILPKNLFDYTK